MEAYHFVFNKDTNWGLCYFEKIYFIGIFVYKHIDMTQVTLHIDNKKKWAAIKTILEAMNITYNAHEPVKEVSKEEQVLLQRAESDVANGRLHPFKSHREILGR